jgi:hypothetical protein
MIKLPASVDDYAYLLKADYDACIESATQEQRVPPLPLPPIPISPSSTQQCICFSFQRASGIYGGLQFA